VMLAFVSSKADKVSILCRLLQEAVQHRRILVLIEINVLDGMSRCASIAIW
jgi:hypothetical protein